MATLHDSGVRSSIEGRLNRLGADTKPAWGRMNAAQMLWHCNQALAAAMGQASLDPAGPPLPRGLVKFMVLNLPWVKNAPTNKALVALDERDFGAELARCRQLLKEFAARPLDGPSQDHPAFGRMSVPDNSRLQAKHLDHHLKQFGV
jgi:hypothetical protein